MGCHSEPACPTKPQRSRVEESLSFTTKHTKLPTAVIPSSEGIKGWVRRPSASVCSLPEAK